jgi:hypothetical protein
VEYFVRTMDVRKQGRSGSAPLEKLLYPDVACAALGQAIDHAKRIVMDSDKALMLQADACSRNSNKVQTKYHCWIDDRGAFNERTLG